MKILLFCLLLPYISVAQTIHADDDTIVYKGEVSLAVLSSAEILQRLQPALLAAIGEKRIVQKNMNGEEMKGKGYVVMNTPYHIIRHLHFDLQIRAFDGGYSYRVDSIFLTEKRRGGKTSTKNASELLEGREETGGAGAESEKLLNEIDLKIQKMLVVLENAVRTGT